MSDNDVILRVEGLDRWYGGVHALDAIDLEVRTGDLHAVIGPNGSGKTTLFKLVTGHTKPSGGRIWFEGEDITGLAYQRVTQRGIAKSYQITTVFPSLTVFENTRIASQAAKFSYVFWLPAGRYKDVAARAEEVLERVGLIDERDEVAGNLSHGDLRKLDLAIALATEPRLLLLDEPTAGMSPAETETTVSLIQEVNKTLSVIMIEHKMEVILDVADRITVLHYGQKLFEGSADEVKGHPQVQEVYLTGAL